MDTFQRTYIDTTIKAYVPLGAKLNLEPEVTSYISGLITPLSVNEKKLLNNLAKSLKVGLGITSLDQFFDYLNIRAGETQEQSLRNFAKRAHDSTAVNSPTWTQHEGFMGNGISNYVAIDYIPSSGNNFQLDDASHGLYFRVFNRDVSNVKYNGVYSTDVDGGINNRLLIGSNSLTEIAVGINSPQLNVNDNMTSGLFILNRKLSSDIIVYKNRTKIGPLALLSTKRPNQKIVELARRGTDDGLLFFNTSKISFSFCAKGLTDAHQAVIVDAFEAYLDAKGKGVIA